MCFKWRVGWAGHVDLKWVGLGFHLWKYHTPPSHSLIFLSLQRLLHHFLRLISDAPLLIFLVYHYYTSHYRTVASHHHKLIHEKFLVVGNNCGMINLAVGLRNRDLGGGFSLFRFFPPVRVTNELKTAFFTMS